MSLFPPPVSTEELPRPWQREEYTGDADISDDGLFRYSLHRSWDSANLDWLIIVGLNPSTAAALDEKGRPIDDPTIRRGVDFADQMGFCGLGMLNGYAYRATDPTVILGAADPIGPRNDEVLFSWLAAVPWAVCAWTDLLPRSRADRVLAIFREAGCEPRVFGTTKGGAPRHPLYLPRTARPVPWTPNL